LNWEEKGYAILDDWSETTQSDNYNSEKNRKRWDELNPDREEKRTIRSLFHDAKEKGWDRQAFEQEWETRDSSQQVNTPKLELKIFRGDELLSTPAPPRRWLIESWIPAAETTMLGGDGGMGKTTLGLQLSVAAVSEQDWLGYKVKRCNVLYVSAEDPKDEIHFRLEQITRHLTITKNELAGFKLIDLAGKESAIALFAKDGRLKRTALFGEIEKAARDHNAGWIIFDVPLRTSSVEMKTNGAKCEHLLVSSAVCQCGWVLLLLLSRTLRLTRSRPAADIQVLRIGITRSGHAFTSLKPRKMKMGRHYIPIFA
jgi:hypothetical protein